VACSVDRIEDPADPAAAVLAELLANDRVAWALTGDRRSERLFGLSVGRGDRRQVDLRLDSELGRAEVLRRDVVREVGEREREGEVVVRQPRSNIRSRS
jgi:hypothetical protein